MTHPLNLNGKRPTHLLVDCHTDYHRLPFEPLVNNATKKPRTLPPISQLPPLHTSTSNSTAATNTTTTSTATTHTTTTTTSHPPHHNSPSITAINTNSNTTSTFINPITAHPSIKKPTPDLPIPQRSTLSKSLSGLVFPHPNQSNTPLDLLNPKATSIPSPTKKPTQPQRTTHHHLLATTPKCQLENQNPLHLDPNRDSRPISKEKQRPKDKEELKRDMAQWQEKYRVAIKSFVFYLDRLDQHTTLDLTSQIRAWGARVDPFFSKDVTHLITDQPVPSQQLIRKSVELKIKIWKSEKLLNVLHRLGDQRSPIKQPPLKPSLPSLLLKEAQQGHTNEYDPIATRSDYYYFGPKAMFIMVEDANQEHKPIIVKEYTRPKTREATSWPVMWGGAEGKSAFSRHSAKQSYLQVRNRIRQSFEMRAKFALQSVTYKSKSETPLEQPKSPDRKPPVPQHVERVPPPVQPNLRRAVSMNILQRRQSARLARNSIYSKPCEAGAPQSDDNVCKEIDHVNANTPEHYRGPGKVFLAASGNSVSVTSNMPSATSTRSNALRPPAQPSRHLVDKRLAALGKRPTFEIHNQANAAASQTVSTKSPGVGTAEPSKNRLQTLRKELNQNLAPTGGNLKRSQSLDSSLIAKKKAQDSKVARNSERKGLGVRAKLGNGFDLLDLRRLARTDEPKAGYCENCRMKYVDFKKHILCRKHRKFAQEEENWSELDYMLRRTTRKLKPGVSVPPSVREMILLTQNDEESEQEEESEEEEEEEEEEESVEEEEEDDFEDD